MGAASPTEIMLTHPELFGLGSATPVQRAICRASDGADLAELWDDPNVRAAFGGSRPTPGTVPPMMLDIGAIRTGKSLKAAAIAVTRSQTADLSSIRRGEQPPRIPICSTSVDNAKIVYTHLVGHVMQSPRLSRLVVGQTADTLTIRHPSGTPVEIKVTAGARAGASLVGRWLAGVVFDEATLLLGSSDGRVRDLDADLLQLQGRMLPGAQVIMIGSTVAPPRGPAYRLLKEHFGHPSRECVAIWSTGPEAHPGLYTDEYLAGLSPEVREVCTKRVFLDPERTWLTPDLLDACTRDGYEELEYDPCATYVVATDPATRTNAWSLVVLGCYPEPPTYRIAHAREWVPQPGERLRIRDVFREIQQVCQRYQTALVVGDRHMADALMEIGAEFGIEYLNADFKRETYNEAYLEMKRLMDDGALELPPNETIRSDLQKIRRVVSARGVLSFEISAPGQGRHCDYIPAILRAVVHRPQAAEVDEPRETREQRARREQDEAEAAEFAPRHDVEGIFGRLHG